MAKASYEVALLRLLRDEGGYTDDKADPGGPTNWGITIADARSYWKKDATAADVKAMPLGVAKDIYRAKYWDAQRCDDLPPGVDYAVFDYGVNSGIGRSGKVLRRKLGLSDSTSKVTDEVIAAALRADPAKLATVICDERLAFLQSLKTWPVFGKGWGRRVTGVRAASIKMASGVGVPEPPSAEPAQGKGAVPANTKAQGAVIAATTGTAAAPVAAGGHPITVLIVVAIAVVVGVGAILLINYLRNRKQEAPVAEPATA